MSENATQTVWLTQEAYDKLRHELDQLSGPGRAEVTAKIAAAREEGDLRENGGYHAAREEQGQQEARIRQLADMLRRAQVGEAPVDQRRGRPRHQGHHRLRRRRVRHRHLRPRLARAARAGRRRRRNVYSPQSPLGAAILGLRPGDDASYVAPNGRSINVTVVKVEPFGG